MQRFVPWDGFASGKAPRCSGVAVELASVKPLFGMPTNEGSAAHLVGVPGMRAVDLATNRACSLSMGMLVTRKVLDAPQLCRTGWWRPLDARSHHHVFLVSRHRVETSCCILHGQSPR